MSGGSKSPGKRVSVQRDPARPDLLYAKNMGYNLNNTRLEIEKGWKKLILR